MKTEKKNIIKFLSSGKFKRVLMVDPLVFTTISITIANFLHQFRGFSFLLARSRFTRERKKERVHKH